jgi:hypothetical protein
MRKASDSERILFTIPVDARGDGEDRCQITLMAEQLESPDESWDRIEARLRAMTRMLVRRHHTLIERVAQALIERKTLSREDLDNLVGRRVDDVKVNAPFLLAMAKMSGVTESEEEADAGTITD